MLVALKVRVSKVLGRLAPSVLMGMVAGQGLALLAAAASMSVGLGLLWSRRGPDRSACVGCPQRTLAVCDGLRSQVRRERALHRWAGGLTAKDFAARLS